MQKHQHKQWQFQRRVNEIGGFILAEPCGQAGDWQDEIMQNELRDDQRRSHPIWGRE